MLVIIKSRLNGCLRYEGNIQVNQTYSSRDIVIIDYNLLYTNTVTQLKIMLITQNWIPRTLVSIVWLITTVGNPTRIKTRNKTTIYTQPKRNTMRYNNSKHNITPRLKSEKSKYHLSVRWIANPYGVKLRGKFIVLTYLIPTSDIVLILSYRHRVGSPTCSAERNKSRPFQIFILFILCYCGVMNNIWSGVIDIIEMLNVYLQA